MNKILQTTPPLSVFICKLQVSELQAFIMADPVFPRRFYANLCFLSNSSVIRQIQDDTSIPSNREDRGRVPPSEPTLVSSSKLNLNFYKESEEASISGAENLGRQAATRSPHIFIQDAQDSGSENEEECQVTAIVPQYAQPKASVALLDEDYDT
jgi:hypothetical protein